ncbi:hypothetical protein [Actinomadura sp. 7K507]|uniref:hypothetical protein n=1 Tax=Actinomadura sp. 7K507 TaxID=2530365 RepID=UPI00104E92D5|nr:hypothetical protein [Actinomadura sp. 7K507]TDC74613.1 hypothetical protein E1285_42900 [Actinomadura sp. 7K507]
MNQETVTDGSRAGARRPVLVDASRVDASGPRLPDVDRALLRPRYRTIMAVDIEGSTSRSDPVKAELRSVLYRLLEEAFNRAGIVERYREAYVDRGDGMLVLVRPLDEVPKTLLLHPVVPILSALLAEYNSEPVIAPGGDRRIRIRVVVHAGEVHSDGRGNFGEALDVAFRLLDSPETKDALRRVRAPLVLVVSDDIYHSIVRHGYEGIRADSYVPAVRQRVNGRSHLGWVHDATASLAPAGTPGLAARRRWPLARRAV